MGDLGRGAQAAASTAVAAINTAAAIKIANQQYQIAKGYLDLAKEMREYWNNSYKPCEVKMVAEACSAPLYEPQYQVTAGRYVAAVRQQFKNALDDASRNASRYCTGLSAMLARDMAVAEATAVGSAMNFGYRYEEARKEVLDQVRWDRRNQALGLGRDLITQSAKYSDMANGALSSLGDQAGRAAAGAMQSLGYSQVRNDGISTGVISGANTGSGSSGVALGRSGGGHTFSGTSQVGARGTFGGSSTTIDPYRLTNTAGVGTGPGSGFGIGQDSGGGSSSDASVSGSTNNLNELLD